MNHVISPWAQPIAVGEVNDRLSNDLVGSALVALLEQAEKKVVVPYAHLLDRRAPLRLLPVLLALIKAHAIFRVALRPGVSDRIAATVEDYAWARDWLRWNRLSVSNTIKRTVRTVAMLLDRRDVDGILVSEVARALGLDTGKALGRVRTAIRRGFLKNLDRRGRPIRVVLQNPVPDDIARLPVPREPRAGTRAIVRRRRQAIAHN